jgi:hypothetical protein
VYFALHFFPSALACFFFYTHKNDSRKMRVSEVLTIMGVASSVLQVSGFMAPACAPFSSTRGRFAVTSSPSVFLSCHAFPSLGLPTKICSVDFIVHAERDSSSIAHVSLYIFYIYLIFYLKQFAHRFCSKAQRPRVVGLCCAWPIVCLLSTGSAHPHSCTHRRFFLALCSAVVSLDESTE